MAAAQPDEDAGGPPAEPVAPVATDSGEAKDADAAAAEAPPAEAADAPADQEEQPVDAAPAEAGDAAAAVAPEVGEAAAPEAGADVAAPEGEAAEGAAAEEAAPAADPDAATANPAPAPEAEGEAAKEETSLLAPAEASVTEEEPSAESASAAGLTTEKVDVPDTTLEFDIQAVAPTSPGDEKAKATAQRLKVALEGMLAECGSDISALPEGEMRDALEKWQYGLASHASDLKDIMEMRSTGAVGAGEDSITDDLEADRTGRDREDLASAWSDPHETEREIQELRRARRQIRSLFGGMVGSLSDVQNLSISDLVSNFDETPREDPLPSGRQIGGDGGYNALRKGVEELPLTSLGGIGGASPSTPGRPPALPGHKGKDGGQLGPQPPGTKNPHQSPRPRSGGTVLSSVTNSSCDTWGSQRDLSLEDEERRREKKAKKERKERKERRDRDRSEGPRSKRDDGAAPKQWNWANEVVQASMDPHNQWEFPAAGARQPNSARGNEGGDEVRLWEQPRQPRGGDVASRARERAQEVLRSEREQQQRLIFGA